MSTVREGPGAFLASWRKGRPRDRALRDSVILIGALVAVSELAGLITIVDAHTYWDAGTDLHAIYPLHWDAASTKFVYPPPLAILFAALHLIPWPIVLVVWTALCFAALQYVAGWIAIPLIASGMIYFAAPSVVPSVVGIVLGWLLLGNVQILIAAVTIAGFRWPALWALPILTKVGPGIGLVWFIVRKDWRSLAIALGTTFAVAAASFFLAPWAWIDWLRFLERNAATPSFLPVVPIAFPIRVALGALLIAWGGRTDRRWTVSVAVGVSSPQLYEWSFLVIWLAAIRLWREEGSRVPYLLRRVLASRLDGGSVETAPVNA